MSRVGKKLIVIPAGVDISVQDLGVTVKGPKGTLTTALNPRVAVAINDGAAGKELTVTTNGMDVFGRSIWGTTRANIANMIEGVVNGYNISLEVIGVGYRVNVQGNKVVLDVGYSHSVDYLLPEGIVGKVEKNVLTLSGIDKVLIGETAAQIRRIREPEPYGGKGIKYIDEVIRRKAGKAAKSGE
ncbi:MAG: 50S ribosomal protein L6 [Patescibacteria group bacterium]